MDHTSLVDLIEEANTLPGTYAKASLEVHGGSIRSHTRILIANINVELARRPIDRENLENLLKNLKTQLQASARPTTEPS